MDYEDSYIQLTDDDGEEYNFEHVLTFDYNGKKYVVLSPCEEFPEEDEEELCECGCDHEHVEECDYGCEDEDEGSIVILEVVTDEDGNQTVIEKTVEEKPNTDTTTNNNDNTNTTNVTNPKTGDINLLVILSLVGASVVGLRVISKKIALKIN